MPNRDSLGDRMKGYENAFRHYLPKRLPVIIRIDGKAFHTYTRGFHKPFDPFLMLSMQETALELCRKIEGVKLAYVQSDEISLLLTNDDTIQTEPWFDNNLQKLCSVAASIATLAFAKAMEQHIFNHCYSFSSGDVEDTWVWLENTYGFTREYMCSAEWNDYFHTIQKANSNGAHFDARAFVLPKDEVVNYFIWRQQDATRNSIQMVAQHYFSHKELQGLNCNKLQDKLLTEKDINWNDFTVPQKRGTCVVKRSNTNCEALRYKWYIDELIPIFTENRDYIEERLNGTNND